MPTWAAEDLLAAPPAPLAAPAARATPDIDYGEGTIESRAPTNPNSTTAHTRNASNAPLVPPTTAPHEDAGEYANADADAEASASTTPTTIQTRFTRNQMTYLKNIYFNQQRPEGGLPHLKFILKSVTPGITFFLPVAVELRGVSRDLKLSVTQKKVAASTWADLVKIVEGSGGLQCLMIKDELRIDCALMPSLAPPLCVDEVEATLKWREDRSVCKTLKQGVGWVKRKMSTKQKAQEPEITLVLALGHQDNGVGRRTSATIVAVPSAAPLVHMRGGQGHPRMDSGCFDAVGQAIWSIGQALGRPSLTAAYADSDSDSDSLLDSD
jgi:hypothetical protein